MMTTTTTNNPTTDTNVANITNITNTVQQQQRQKKERKPKWMRAPTPQEKKRGARLILEAAGLLRRVGATAAGAEAEEGEGEMRRDEWRDQMALNARLHEPSVVAAARRLFPLLVGRAMRQDPDTIVTGVMYEPSVLLDSFLLARHPHRFSHEGMRRMGEPVEEQEAQIALMDAGAVLAETFEVLLREFLLHNTPRRSSTTTAAGGRKA